VSKLIHDIEEVSLTTWPALQTAFYDGWVLRFAGGFTRRANSVNALYPSRLDPVQKIETCAAWFRSRGQRPVFKLTEAAQPADLDTILDQQGYAREGSTSVQLLSLQHYDTTIAPDVNISASATAAWLESCVAFNGFDPARGTILSRILDNMTGETAFAAISMDDSIVAVGLGVASQGYLSLFDIATVPAQRNQGLGRRIVCALLAWGAAQGAQQAFLQVVPENTPALHLYASLGFREIYQYWYRA
jgi:ribosomal protein S18 acetylase RimI-like enzyme